MTHVAAIPTWRSRAADVASVLAALWLVAAVASWWSATRPYDSERVAAAVAVALEDPVVTEAVARAATDQLVDLAFLVADPRELLPGPLGALSSQAEEWLRDLLAAPVERVVRTAPVRRVVVAAAREAHAEVVVALRDGRSERGVLTVDDRIVRLDLTGVLAAGLDALVDRNLLPGALGDLHDALRGGADALGSFLTDTVGFELSSPLGTVVVYDAGEVDEGGLALRSARWLSAGGLSTPHHLALAVASAGVALGSGRDPRRAATVAGLGLVVTSLLTHLYVGRVRHDLLDVLGEGAASRVAEVVAGELLPSLVVALAVTAATGVALAALGRALPGRTVSPRP
jgi:hypothetical protein